MRLAAEAEAQYVLSSVRCEGSCCRSRSVSSVDVHYTVAHSALIRSPARTRPGNEEADENEAAIEQHLAHGHPHGRMRSRCRDCK